MEHHFYAVLFVFLSVIFLANLPAGFLRGRYARFSRPWARCIYIPLIFDIMLRRLVGLSYKTIPAIVFAVIIGQIAGERLFNPLNNRGKRRCKNDGPETPA